MAVGLSLKKSNFAKFAEEFEKIAKEAQTDEIVSVVKIDKELTPKDLRIETVQELKLLEPFGEGNKMPTFIYKNLKIMLSYDIDNDEVDNSFRKKKNDTSRKKG